MVDKSALISKAPNSQLLRAEDAKATFLQQPRTPECSCRKSWGHYPLVGSKRGDEDTFLLTGSETTPGYPEHPLDVDIFIGHLGKARHGAEQPDPF